MSATSIACLSLFAQPVQGQSLPTGGQVITGSATIAQSGASQLAISQQTNRAVTNWQSFSIGERAAVDIRQPSADSVSVNQVVGQNPSNIFGSLTSNGHVVIANPNGIWFGRDARVDVGGLTATTATMTASKVGDFMASGKLDFDTPGLADSAVVNDGAITIANAGLAALVAPGVANTGTIRARLGKVQLVSGTRYTLDLRGDGLVHLAVDDKVLARARGPDGKPLAAAVVNSGRIDADGGSVYLDASAAKSAVDNVIDMSGVVEARGVQMAGGDIVLTGNDSGTVAVSGTLDASGQQARQTGGTVKVLGGHVALDSGASIDVSGQAGGGTALIGGNFHGAGPERNAETTTISPNATIRADAIRAGNGGKVAVWSNQATRFAGAISAKGGTQGGDGGFVETSGHMNLDMLGSVDTSAPRGLTGTLLLDPYNVSITRSGSRTNESCTGSPTTTCSPTASGAIIPVSGGSGLNTLLASNSVVITTSNAAGSEAGTITFSGTGTTVTVGSGHSLTLTADSTITMNTGWTISSTGSNAGVTLTSLGGQIVMLGTAKVQSVDSDITFSAATGITTTAISASGAGNISFTTSGAGATITVGDILTSTSGNINFTTTGANAGVTINETLTAGSGNIGVNATGAVNINAGTSSSTTGAGGDITVVGNGVTIGSLGYLDTAGGTGKITVATSGAFTNNSDNGAGSGVAGIATGTGRWLVYSQNPANDLVNGLVYSFRQYNTSYGTAPTPSSGNGFLYTLAPTLTPGLTGTTTKTYNGDTSAALLPTNYTLSNPIGQTSDAGSVADTVSANTNAPSTGNYLDKNVGSGKTVSVSGMPNTPSGSTGSMITATNKDGAGNTITIYGYTLSTTSVSRAMGTINQLPVTLSGTRTYDGSTTASSTILSVSNKATGDTLTLSGSGTLASKNAGAEAITSFGTLALGGTDAGNYTLVGGSGSVNINALPVTLTGTRVYDGSTTAASTILSITNKIGSDDVSLASGAGTLASKNVGSQAIASFGTMALGGTDAGNYTFVGGSGSVSISALAVNLTGTRTYDGSATAANTILSVANKIGSDDVSLVSGSGALAGKNVGAQAITGFGTLVLGGTDAGNYTFVGGSGSVNVSQLPLTLAGTRVYDGSTNAASTILSITNKIGSDDVSLASGAGTLASKNAGSESMASFGTLALGGTDAGNYTLVGGSGSVNVSALAVNLTGVRTYDGSTTAASTILSVSNKVAGDTLTLSGSGTLASKNVGSQAIASFGTLALGGTDAGNYTFVGGSGSVSISALAVNLAGTRTYDGSATAANTILSVANKIGSDDVNLVSGSGSLASKNVGAQAITSFGTLALGGTDAGNYTLVGGSGSVNVNQLPVMLTGTRVYDASATAASTILSVSNKATGDTLTLSGSGTLASKNAGAEAIASFGTLALGGTDAGNYTLVGGSGSVNVIALAVNLTGVRTYDGSTTAASTILSVTNKIGSDDVSLASGASTLASKNVGSQAITSFGTLALGGTDAGNYTFVGGSGSINVSQLPITLSGTRAYDGSTTAASTILSVSNKAAGDTLILSGNGTLASKTVGAQAIAGFGTLVLGGTDAGNYTFVGGSGSVNVSQLPLTLAGTRVYDGSTNAASTILSITNKIGSDDVSLASGAGTLASKNAGSESMASFGTLTLSGVDAGNYTLVGGSGSVNVSALAVNLTGTRTYDGSATAANTILSVANKIGSDDVSLVSGSGALAGKNVGAQAITSFGTLALGGTDAGNYTFVGGSGLVSISALAVNLTGMRTYDGSTTASSAILSVSNEAVGDTLTLSGSGTLASKNAGSEAITGFGTLALGGTDAGNYTLVGGSGSINVSPKNLTVANLAANSKVYDGGTAATINAGSAALLGAAAGDAVSLSTAGVVASFADKNVGAGKAVALTGLTLGGADAGNYTFSQPAALTADITPAPLTITAHDKTKAFLAPLPAFTASYSGFKTTDDASIVSGLTITTPATVNSPAGSYPIVPGGATAANYTIGFVDGVLTVLPGPPAPSGGDAVPVALLAENAGAARSGGPVLPAGNLGAGAGLVPRAGGPQGEGTSMVEILSAGIDFVTDITHAFANAYLEGSESIPEGPQPVTSARARSACTGAKLMPYQQCIQTRQPTTSGETSPNPGIDE